MINKYRDNKINFRLYVFRILFSNDPQQMAKKMVPKHGYKKRHNGENAFEVLLFLYKQCTQNAFSVMKINGFILETCHMCG